MKIMKTRDEISNIIFDVIETPNKKTLKKLEDIFIGYILPSDDINHQRIDPDVILNLIIKTDNEKILKLVKKYQ